MIEHHLTYEQYHNLGRKIEVWCQLTDEFDCRVYINTDLWSSGFRIEFNKPSDHTLFLLKYGEYL